MPAAMQRFALTSAIPLTLVLALTGLLALFRGHIVMLDAVAGYCALSALIAYVLGRAQAAVAVLLAAAGFLLLMLTGPVRADIAPGEAYVRTGGLAAFTLAALYAAPRWLPGARIRTTMAPPNEDGAASAAGAGIEDVAEASRLEAHESLRRLAGGFAHDVSNLMTVIIGNAELALMTPPADQQLKRDLEEIHEAAHRAANLAQQLLAFSRRQMIEPRVLDLDELVRGAEPEGGTPAIPVRRPDAPVSLP